jgi:hypothetical protein
MRVFRHENLNLVNRDKLELPVTPGLEWTCKVVRVLPNMDSSAGRNANEISVG